MIAISGRTKRIEVTSRFACSCLVRSVEELLVALFDRGPSVVHDARLVDEVAVLDEESADRLRVPAADGLLEIIGASADHVFVAHGRGFGRFCFGRRRCRLAARDAENAGEQKRSSHGFTSRGVARGGESIPAEEALSMRLFFYLPTIPIP